MLCSDTKEIPPDSLRFKNHAVYVRLALALLILSFQYHFVLQVEMLAWSEFFLRNEYLEYKMPLTVLLARYHIE